ncbi:hypothetical protein [Tautonia plasticadhaerens]|uniref:hypothetical protein n=1 Tax=Tautonia plasticadhaerens TaxID=2527974 RepID=UPI0011A8AD6C|nr:hypothetical protein [Tautonia plasticadhaerens]
MAIRQTRIYASSNVPYDDQHWAETIMARIIQPLVTNESGLRWFWFTRYADVEPEFADSDGTHYPDGFHGDKLCRSIRLRLDIDDDAKESFESRGSELIEREGCWIADWRDYGIQELCSNRFIGEDRAEDRRGERLNIVKDYLGSISRLALHALVPADGEGRFRFEHNDDPLNMYGSPFFSLHHLFCNTTEVLLTVLIANDGSNLVCGTRQYAPQILYQNPGHPCVERRVRF